MKERLIKILKSRVTASIIFILLGACLAFMPVATVYVLYKVIFGVVMIAAGVFQLYLYLSNTRDSTLLNMFAGSILVVLGGFLFFNPQIVVKLLPLLLGTFVLVDSVWSLQAAVKLKKKELSAWVFVMAGSTAFVGLSIVGMLNPFREVKFTIFFSGCVLLGNGVADVVYLLLIRYWKKKVSSAGGPEGGQEPSEKEAVEEQSGEASEESLQEWESRESAPAVPSEASEGSSEGDSGTEEQPEGPAQESSLPQPLNPVPAEMEQEEIREQYPKETPVLTSDAEIIDAEDYTIKD